MSIEFLVEVEGLEKVQAVVIPLGSTVREVVVAAAEMGGFGHEQALLFVEDGDEPIDLTIVVDEGYQHQRVHHVHRSHRIKVSVLYNGVTKTHEFSPATRVAKVLEWAVGSDGFAIDTAIAPEFVLLIGERELPVDAHIGRFLRHHEECLHLELGRGSIQNG